VGNNHHLATFEGEDIQIFEKDLPGENEAGFSPNSVISKLPLETCQTMNNSWGYNIHDNNYKSADYLIQYLVKTAGKGANLLLNVGPRPDGTIPESAVERLLAMGRWLDRYGDSIYGTQGGYIAEQEWGVTTQRGNILFVHVLKPGTATVEIEVPAGNKLQSASVYFGTPVKFTTRKEGKKTFAVVTVPDGPEVDNILKLTFRKEL
jgi:alpha-L-fucosidase